MANQGFACFIRRPLLTDPPKPRSTTQVEEDVAKNNRGIRDIFHELSYAVHRPPLPVSAGKKLCSIVLEIDQVETKQIESPHSVGAGAPSLVYSERCATGVSGTGYPAAPNVLATALCVSKYTCQ